MYICYIYGGVSGAKLLQLCLTPCNPMECSLPTPLSMGFSRQEYWSGLPCPSPGDLPNPEIESASLMSPVLADGFFIIGTTWEVGLRQAIVHRVANSWT